MPKPELVASGVYRVDAVPLPNLVSALLINDDEGWTLVDTGVGSSPGRIREALAALGGRPEDLGRVFLTHHHIDHIGGLPGVRGWAPGAELIATEHEAEIISGRRRADLPSNAITRYLNQRQKLPTAPVDRVMREGEVVAGFRVISTPGHTLGHASLLRDEDGLLLTGDAFGNFRGRARVGGLKVFCTDPPQAKRSAEKLLNEEFGNVIMTHGRPLYAEARRELGEAVARCDYA